MNDLDQTKEQLVTELTRLRQRMAELEGIETEHKQTKEALQESETQYRRLFEAAKDGILIIDAETGKITAVNPFLLDLLDYSETEMVGKKLWEISSFKDVKISKLAFEELQREEYIRYEDVPLETRNGRSIAVEFVSCVYLANHKKVIQCNIRDITERKEAEEALHESEARYRRTLDNMLGSCQIIDFDWRYVYVNEAAARQGKRKPAELLQHTMMEMYPGIENTELFTVLRRCMEERSLERMENKFLYPNGETGWFELSIQPVPEGIFILSLDITARNQAEAALRQSEERFAKAFRASPAALSITRPTDGCFVDVNESFQNLLGYSHDELIGHRSTELNMFTNPDERAEMVRRLREQGSVRNCEMTLRAKSGELRNVLFSTEMIELEGEAHALAILFDITERKQAEQALRVGERKLKTLFEILPVGISVLDAEGKVVYVNPALERILDMTTAGLPNKDYKSRTYFRSDRTLMPAEEFASARAIREQREVRDVEVGVGKEDGNVIWTNVSAVPVEFSDWKVVVVTSDITTRKQLEAENEQLAAQFYQAQKLDSIGQLAGGIAHDFNNMLVPIIGYAELGLMKLAPDSPICADFKRIKEAGERAADLTRQILAFSRQQELELKLLHLNPVIIEFEPMLRRLIGENIDLQTRLAAKLPLLKADKGQLEQVLLNLVVNARDAMPDGGTLIIETAQVALDETYVAQHLEALPGPQVLLAVSDTGQGMDAATQQRIFEPFFTTKARGRGTGLGLATVFGIVKQHGGNIWVYSEPGQGTTFKIYLPLADVSDLVAEPELLEAGLFGGTETVLLVEDEASVRELVSETLRTYGYRVLEASEPKKGLALAAAHEGPIQLLLTDIVMPQMNGRELYRQLAMGRSGLKVLYMSGYTDHMITQNDVLDKEMAFLQKPFTLYGLLQKVRVVLG